MLTVKLWRVALGLVITSAAWAAEPQSGPQIVGRSAWGAKPVQTSKMTPQKPNALVIHHTSVQQQPRVSLERKLQRLQAFSQSQAMVGKLKKPAWADVPYHYYIDVSGRIGEGRDVSFAGDTNTNYDLVNRILIVVEGQFDQEEPSAAQLQALTTLVVWLTKKYAIDPANIAGHNDFAATDCPGRNLKSFLPTLRKAAADGAQ